MVYDTAVRIGAYLNLEPEEVYLHAGTKKGAAALGFKHRKTIDPKVLPREFQSLSAVELRIVYASTK